MIANLISILNSSTPGEASTYRSVVNADGGTVTDYDYLKARIKHAKDNGYFDSIVWWGSPSFGLKESASLCSKLYDVINVASNSLQSVVGSEQPQLITGQNSKPALRGDGLSTSLYTSHQDIILDKNKTYFVFFVFKPISHNANVAKTYFQEKPDTTKNNFSQQGTSARYQFYGNIAGVDSSVAANHTTGIPNLQFSIMSINFRDKTVLSINDFIQNYYGSGKDSSINGFLGLSLFGNYSSTPATFSASKTNYDLYELLIVEGTHGYDLIDSIKQQINNYYNYFIPFEYNKPERLLDGISNLECVVGLYNRVTGYSGNCFKLRRSSDNAESDFGFVNDFVDVAAITTWAAGSNLFIRTFYDQSGNSDFQQATAGNQMQFFLTGGGDDNLQPYVNMTTAANTQMSRSSSMTSADLFKIYAVGKQTVDTGVLMACGGSTNYVSFGVNGTAVYLLKVVASVEYYRRSSLTWKATGETLKSSMAIMCASNEANTPSANDVHVYIQTREEYTSATRNPNPATASTMYLGKSASGTAYNGQFHEMIIVKNITHNQKTIEQNLVRVYQQLP